MRLERFVIFSFSLVGHLKPIADSVKAGVHLKRAKRFFYRPVILLREVESSRHVQTNSNRKRIEFPGACYLGDGLLVAPHRGKIRRIPLKSRRIIWVEVNRPLESSFPLGPVP